MKRLALLGMLALGCGTNPHTQPRDCKLKLDCDVRLDAGSPGQSDPTIGRDGTCWYGGLAAADSCTARCVQDLANAIAAHPDAGCAEK